MLAVRRIVVIQHAVIQIIATQQQPDQAHASVDQNPQRDPDPQQPRRHQLAGVVQPINQRVENEARAEDHAGLKAAARPVIAVKLDIQREQ